MKAALAQTENDIKNLSETAGVKDKSQLYIYYKLRDILITQSAVLSSFINYSDTVGDTRGSSLYFDKNGKLRRGLEELFRFSEENESFRSKIQETYKVVIPSVAIGVMFAPSPMTTISLKTYGEVTEKIRIYIDKTIYILHSIKKTR